MSVLPVGFASASDVDVGDIGHSLRLRSAASASLTRTITTDATSTYFAAIKRGKLGVVTPIFDANIKFNANDTLTAFGLTTTAVFRDPTSWLFIHVSNGGLYVNGVSYGAVTTSSITNPRIGYDGTNYADMYVARIGVVGGTSSSYTNFGYQNTQINEWVTKSQSAVKAVVDAGGTNSFMLDFDDATSTTTLGYDNSSKGNNWTLNNVSLTAGSTYDWMLDVPGNSFATLNPLNKATAITTSYGNLRSTSTSYPQNIFSTQSLPQSGKFYCELFSSTATNASVAIGFGVSTQAVTPASAYNATGKYGFYSSTTATLITGAGGLTAISAGYTNTAGLPFKIAADLDAGKVWIGQQTTWWDSSGGTTGNPETGANPTFTIDARGFNIYCDHESIGAFDWDALFGQAPLHASATYHSAAGGYFRYAPPSGFKALCQANLPTPAILNPEVHHNVYTVTKSGNTNFTLDWDASVYDTYFEIKRRNAVGDWYNVDGLRGYDKILKSNGTAAEATDANVISVSGTTCTLKSTLADGTYVISAWKAGLTASRQTNTDGSITSTVSRNVTSGFAIVTYTSPNLSSDQTVGHGLGIAPKEITAKNLDNTFNWDIWHEALTGNDYGLLFTPAAQAAGRWTTTAPTTAVFSTKNTYEHNSTNRYVAYVRAEIPGYSKFGSYTGNGNADGPYVECGFKPKFVMVKRTDSTGDWLEFDAVRSPDNVANEYLIANGSSAEFTDGVLDLTATGFKWRTTGASANASGGTYIFIAFADVPGKYSLAR